MKRKIVLLNEPILRTASTDLTNLKEIKELSTDLVDTAGDISYGLSAIQIGEAKNILITHPYDEDKPWNIFVNPRVYELSPEAKISQEGCLSIPGVFDVVTRPKWVEIGYWDEYGEYKEAVLENFEATVFLHEYDHLHGFIFLDRCGNREGRREFKRRYKVEIFRKEWDEYPVYERPVDTTFGIERPKRKL